MGWAMPDESVDPVDPGELTQLLRRAQLVVRHHRFHGQEVDPREVAERVVAGHNPRYRQLIEEAVAALVHGLR
jgi:hypothetical protein